LFVSQGGENRILVFNLNDQGLPKKDTADYVIGEPSLYGRKQPVTTAMASRTEGAGMSGIAYDSLHDRLVARDGSRLLMFDVRPDHMKNGPAAIAVFGKPNFTDRLTTGVGPKLIASIDGTVLDARNQRLFVADGRNNRIMVWDIDPARLTATPDPLAVIGQTDYTSKTSGAGADHLYHPGSLYYDDANNRLFVSDSGNNRVLVFDVGPRQLQTGMKAMAVIGQANFEDHEAGIGAARLDDPARLAHDPSTQRLFVGDAGNHRILVFNVTPDQLKSGLAASYVFGQDDFDSRKPRTNLRKAIGVGSLQIDTERERLYLTEPIDLNRALVFDINPSHMKNNPDAIAVLFQESFDKIDWKVSRNEETWPRPFLDAEDGKLYVAASHPGGNRVSIFDISGGIKPTGMPSITAMGQFGWDGKVDFEARPAGSRVNGRVFYPRLLALDAVDHRLFVGDQYNSRVLVFELDTQNRILSRTATVILGQPDAYTARLWDVSARNLELPHSLAYDPVNKWLFVADGWHDRIMVFDADPKRMKTYEDAMFVLGQPDFTTIKPAAGPAGVNFEVIGESRGIGGGGTAPVALAVDARGRRLFVSDGGNNRVLVYDISQGKLHNGAAAVNVIGQPDFDSTGATPASAGVETTAMASGAAQPTNTRGEIYGAELGGEEGGGGGSGRKERVTNDHGFDSPAGLALDSQRNRLFVVDGNNARVLIFDVSPQKLHNGMKAIAVIGQKDFTIGNGTRLQGAKVSEEEGRRRFSFPSSLAYDPVKDWLYVADRGNERTLVFDVAPDKLQSDPGAIGVLGKDNYSTDVVTRAEQEELVEPRELAIDSEHQRLFQTDTPMSRVLVYDLPQSEMAVDVAPRSTVNYSTTDPWNGRDKPDLDQKKDWTARVAASEGSGVPAAMLTYTKTQGILDPMSERRSRILVSETTVAAPKPSEVSWFYMDEGSGKDHAIVVSNPNAHATSVEFRFDDGQRTQEAKRSIPAAGRIEVLASNLFGEAVHAKVGTLMILGEQPVASLLLRRTHTSRGEDLLLAVPPAETLDGSSAAIAGLSAGGGYDSELVLVNPRNEVVSGHIEVLEERTGRPVQWNPSCEGEMPLESKIQSGAEYHVVAERNGQFAHSPQSCEGLSYNIQPGGTYHVELHSDSYLPEKAYAVLRGDQGAAIPWAAAVVSLRNGPLLLSETAVPARAATQLAWIPVDTMPDLIRNGETPSKMTFTIADADTVTPALLRFTLFDTNGKEAGRYEQILPPGTQREWSLADLFNMEKFKGSVRLWSDAPVAISDRRVTTTLRGESVESEIGYVDEASLKGKRTIPLPTISDGAGVATEITFINPTEAEIKGRIQFDSSDGQPSDIVLR
jgi:DNA-binding beta-propeller fold protein YncE